MPFQRPTLPQLAAQLLAGFQGGLPGADTAPRRSNLGVAALAMAGACDGEYGYLDWIIDNCLMPDTAIAPYSNRWGALRGVYPKPPVAATGNAVFTGLAGSGIPQGTVLQLQPGVTFATTAPATIGSGGNVTAPISAILTAPGADGSNWNCAAGAGLALVQAIPGVSGNATAAAAIANGAAAESNAAFVQRYLQVYRAPPQGGDQQDYVEWALQLPAVTRAWCNPLGMGAGSVVVYFMEDVIEAAYGGFPQGSNGVAADETRAVPATGDQLALANYLYPLRPATALVYCFAPVATAQNFTLRYVPTAQQGAVETAIAGILAQEGSPLGAAAAPVYLADIENAVRGVPNCATALVSVPADNITTALGYLPILGTVTFS